MLPISILRKAYLRMFDLDVQSKFVTADERSVWFEYEKAWEACIIEVCSEKLSEDLKIASNNREAKMRNLVSEIE